KAWARAPSDCSDQVSLRSAWKAALDCGVPRCRSPMVANRPGVDTPETPAARCARLEAENRALRAMAGRLFATQEAERRAVARSLHDQAGQSLTAIRMAATLAMQEADPARVREDLADIIVQADAALAEARRLCSLLRPPQLDALGLEAALRGHVEG